ncbi:MAG: MBOAT family O-acyltransferase [Clostridia bacterium]|nr:MBOAT family O-acyltransferase [Clostridia bacterium]
MLANIAFFCFAGVKYLPFIATTALSTYLVGRVIGKIYENADLQIAECNEQAEKKQIRQLAKRKAKRALLVGLFIVVGLLAVCKYTAFVLKNLNGVLTAFDLPQISTFNMILPIGISFYTFMAIGYVLDIYWKRYKAESNFLSYAVFVSYFPHVVQGPIDRYNEFKAQTEHGVRLSYKNITYGAQLAIWGFFKKLVIADRIGVLVDTVLGDWQQYGGAHLFLTFAVYSIQIYADFSGCIDIVSGVSEMFGIKLRKNFNHPYFSKTMGEFWRRWHISLQEWFKDYIYYPVSVSRFVKGGKKKLKAKGKKRAEELFASCFPVLVVWLITGIWHGAAWKFVAWGLFHASLLIGSQVFAPLFDKINKLFKINTDNFGWRLWQMVRTFVLCCIGRIFFRADGLMVSLSMIKHMLLLPNIPSLFDNTINLGLDASNMQFAVFSILVLWAIDMLQEKMSLRQELSKQNIVFRWIIIFAAIFAIIIFGTYGPEYNASSFIYEQF